jgi:hypothetical protein
MHLNDNSENIALLLLVHFRHGAMFVRWGKADLVLAIARALPNSSRDCYCNVRSIDLY